MLGKVGDALEEGKVGLCQLAVLVLLAEQALLVEAVTQGRSPRCERGGLVCTTQVCKAYHNLVQAATIGPTNINASVHGTCNVDELRGANHALLCMVWVGHQSEKRCYRVLGNRRLVPHLSRPSAADRDET